MQTIHLKLLKRFEPFITKHIILTALTYLGKLLEYHRILIPEKDEYILTGENYKEFCMYLYYLMQAQSISVFYSMPEKIFSEIPQEIKKKFSKCDAIYVKKKEDALLGYEIIAGVHRYDNKVVPIVNFDDLIYNIGRNIIKNDCSPAVIEITQKKVDFLIDQINEIFATCDNIIHKLKQDFKKSCICDYLLARTFRDETISDLETISSFNSFIDTLKKIFVWYWQDNIPPCDITVPTSVLKKHFNTLVKNLSFDCDKSVLKKYETVRIFTTKLLAIIVYFAPPSTLSSSLHNFIHLSIEGRIPLDKNYIINHLNNSKNIKSFIDKTVKRINNLKTLVITLATSS